jgi:hypothetical protein
VNVPKTEYNIFNKMMCLFVNSHINRLVIRKQCFKLFTLEHDSNIQAFYCGLVMFQEIGRGFWVDITQYNFPIQNNGR